MTTIAIVKRMEAMNQKQMHARMVFSIVHFKTGIYTLISSQFHFQLLTFMKSIELDIKLEEVEMFTFQVAE